jgi:DNA gyrase subunit A
VGASVVTKEASKTATWLVIMGNGYGKQTDLSEFKIQGRGGSGVRTAKITTKTGPLISANLVTPESSELIVVSKKGQVIKMEIETIPTLGRDTQGVRVMKLREGDELASATLL